MAGVSYGFGGSPVSESFGSTFVNNSGLNFGSSGNGVTDTATTPSSTATSSEGGGVPSDTVSSDGTLTGSVSSLLNNTTVWLALGAIATIYIIWKHKKG